MRGPPNSPVTMILQRGGKGGEPIVVTLLRAVLGGAPVHVAAPTATPTRAAAPAAPQPSTFAPPAPVPAPFPPFHDPAPAAPPATDPTEMHEALCIEFKNIAFLWEEKQNPMVSALVEWKDDLLYGGPRTISTSSSVPASTHNNAPIWPSETRFAVCNVLAVFLSQSLPGYAAAMTCSGASKLPVPSKLAVPTAVTCIGASLAITNLSN